MCPVTSVPLKHSYINQTTLFIAAFLVVSLQTDMRIHEGVGFSLLLYSGILVAILWVSYLLHTRVARVVGSAQFCCGKSQLCADIQYLFVNVSRDRFFS
jgi:hypothetical protein